MIPLPLDQLSLDPRHHLAARWWLGWLYRNPKAFRGALEAMPQSAYRSVCSLLAHALPWVLVISILGRGSLMETSFPSPTLMSSPWGDRWMEYELAASKNMVFGLVVRM